MWNVNRMGMLDARGWSSFHLTFDATRMSFRKKHVLLLVSRNKKHLCHPRRLRRSNSLLRHFFAEARARRLSPKLMNYIITFVISGTQHHSTLFAAVYTNINGSHTLLASCAHAPIPAHLSPSPFLLLYSNDSSNLMTKYRPVRVLCAQCTHTHSFHFTRNLLFFLCIQF